MKIIIAILFIICHQKVSAQNTHTVTCSNVYMRTDANVDANQIMLLPKGSKVTYIKESLYRERIEVNGDNLPYKWYYVSYEKGSTKKYGWVYAGCLSRIANTNFATNIAKEISLANRHMFVGFCELNSDQCTLDCACDCCSFDLYFLSNGSVIKENYCCCEGPIDYSFGKYTIKNGKVTITYARKTMEYDEENHSVNEAIMDDVGYDEFYVDVCPQGMLLCQSGGNDVGYMTTGKRGGVKQKLAELRKIGVLKK